MKKVFGAVVAAAAASCMMMSAFGGELTADQVLANYLEAAKTANEVSATVDMEGKISLNIPDAGMTMEIGMGADMTEAATLNPLALQASYDMNMTMMAQKTQMSMEMYMAQADDGIHMYMNATQDGQESGWQHQVLTGEQADMITNALASVNNGEMLDPSSLPLTFTLAEGTVDVNGTACYELTSVMTWDDLKNVIVAATKAAGVEDQIPQDALDQVGQFAAGLKVNMVMDVDTQTFLPVKAHFDMDGSDWTVISAVAASTMNLTKDDGTLMNVDLTVPVLYMDIFYDYTTPVNVTIPAEAQAAPAIQMDVNALTDAAASTAAGTVAG